MLIVADENIPLLTEFFEGAGEIRRLPGRSIDRAAVADADVLLVRSVTKVTREMLTASPVKFIGTCTIGTDHLDLDYFNQNAIHWSSAPGCNARGVVDYILSSLFTLADLDGVELAGRTYGIVGAGQVGGRLVTVLRGLGWDVRVCDPLCEPAPGEHYVSLDEILAECDVISLHTPLTHSGPAPTWHLLDADRLARLRPGAWLLNAARGPVVDNLALRELLVRRDDVQAVLDVWEHEPGVDLALADLCVLATPHIAGYSLDGRQRGTEQIYRAFCAWQGRAPERRLVDLLPQPWLSGLTLAANSDPAWALAMVCRAVYDPRRDDAEFRRSLTTDEGRQRAAFDALRKHYPPRREIDGLQVSLAGDAPLLRQQLHALGIQLG